MRACAPSTCGKTGSPRCATGIWWRSCVKSRPERKPSDKAECVCLCNGEVSHLVSLATARTEAAATEALVALGAPVPMHRHVPETLRVFARHALVGIGSESAKWWRQGQARFDACRGITAKRSFKSPRLVPILHEPFTSENVVLRSHPPRSVPRGAVSFVPRSSPTGAVSTWLWLFV